MIYRCFRSNSAPEGFDVIEGVINPQQRKNLAEISKMLNQISVGKLFASENTCLTPLNEYVEYAGNRFATYFKNGEFLKQLTLIKDYLYWRGPIYSHGLI